MYKTQIEYDNLTYEIKIVFNDEIIYEILDLNLEANLYEHIEKIVEREIKEHQRIVRLDNLLG